MRDGLVYIFNHLIHSIIARQGVLYKSCLKGCAIVLFFE